jgi:hypothetical protein
MMDILARLGKVFGWLGNGLAVAVLLFAVSAVYKELSAAWSPKIEVAREFTRADGLRVIVVGPYDTHYNIYAEGGASAAAEKYNPDSAFIGPKSSWRVFPAAGRTPKQEAAYSAAYYQQHDESAAALWSRAFDSAQSTTGVLLVVAAVFALIGNALRYVLSGKLVG